RPVAGRSARATRVSCGSAEISIVVWDLDMFYSSLLDARSHRNPAGGSASTGVFAGSGQPRRNFDFVGFLAAGSVDSRFLAGNVVTELRAAHGSGRVDQGRDCASRGGTGLYRGGKAEWSLQAGKVSGEASGGVSVSARCGPGGKLGLRDVGQQRACSTARRAARIGRC